MPLLSDIKNQKILDVGMGTGYYTRILTDNNKVVGVDVNPHLCKLPIKVHKGGAEKLGKLVGNEKFDIVFSVWMTEYLDENQLKQFIIEAKNVLSDGGRLITTIISKYGMGFVYITAAKMLRGIEKYNYTKKTVISRIKDAGFGKCEIVNLNSWLYVPLGVSCDRRIS